MSLRPYALAAVLFVAGCATAPTAAPSRPASPLLFGISAYGGTQLGESDASALSATLTHRLGQPVVAIVFGDESSLAEALSRGAIDAAWMPPLSFMESQVHSDARPIAKAVRKGMDHYRSVIFVRADRGISSLKDLQGKTIAWVDKRSAAGYTFPRAMFQQANLKPSELLAKEDFLGDHASVCRAVVDGRADAGATFMDDHAAGAPQEIDGCLQALGPTDTANLTAISVSKPIPNDVVAVRAGCPPDTASAFKSMFLALGNDADGKSILTSVFKADGFTSVAAEDFGVEGSGKGKAAAPAAQSNE